MPKLNAPPEDLAVFAAAGLAAWLVTSGFYAAFGGGLIEISIPLYLVNAMLAAGASATAFDTLVRLRRAHPWRRAVGAAFIVPTLIAEAGLLMVFRSHVDHPLRYGLYLVIGQAAVAMTALDRPRKRYSRR